MKEAELLKESNRCSKLEAVTVKMLEMKDGSMEADGMECAL